VKEKVKDENGILLVEKEQIRKRLMDLPGGNKKGEKGVPEDWLPF